MVVLCGVEEAGRGPVIGPLVMCGVLIDEKDEDKLIAIGAKDSKLLTPKTREILFDQIKGMVKEYKIIIIPPAEIDKTLLSKDSNLNWLEADTSITLINALKPDVAILDCPSTNITAYRDYVKTKLKNKKIKVIAEHKADVKYPVVSAASILAKVTRDREIEKLKKKIGMDFGSGYPSDARTQGFLKKHYKDFPDIFRKTWSSYKRIAGDKKQKNLGEF
ncbi:ribonuclease HII [Candidatus Woesearchaeota archaeon]|nr:ribonuclease HII [Candidatus Woesearchaeota archaeon]MBW2993988.1 ribonuclease HII [Candidatus Woesearchaeota archaeon]